MPQTATRENFDNTSGFSFAYCQPDVLRFDFLVLPCLSLHNRVFRLRTPRATVPNRAAGRLGERTLPVPQIFGTVFHDILKSRSNKVTPIPILCASIQLAPPMGDGHRGRRFCLGANLLSKICS